MGQINDFRYRKSSKVSTLSAISGGGRGGGRDKYDPTTCYVLLSDISRFLFQQQSIIWQHWCLLGAVRDTKYQNCDMEAAEGSELALNWH